MHLNLTRTLLATAAVLAFSAMPAYAEMVKFSADLTGGAEVPPTDSTATGKVEATLDTDTCPRAMPVSVRTRLAATFAC